MLRTYPNNCTSVLKAAVTADVNTGPFLIKSVITDKAHGRTLGKYSMYDSVVEAVRNGEINHSNISYSLLRQRAGVNKGLFDNLGRGRAVLGSTDELDQYLHSYGPMTESQWHNAVSGIPFRPESAQLIDYGCGQGLGAAILFDYYGEEFTSSIKKLVLIEPSRVALNRAEAILSCYCCNAEIITINKKIDDVRAYQLGISEEMPVIHIFSNVLDISSFDHIELLDKMFSAEGEHFIFAVSSDRDFQGGSARFTEVCERILDPNYGVWFDVKASNMKKFEHRNMRAVSWFFNAEVQSGFV